MSMNQGKLDVVKQEMVRVNTDIFRISELKWTGMGEFNSDNHCIYYCGQESVRGNRVAIIVNKSLKCSPWMQSQKQQDDLCSFPTQKQDPRVDVTDDRSKVRCCKEQYCTRNWNVRSMNQANWKWSNRRWQE